MHAGWIRLVALAAFAAGLTAAARAEPAHDPRYRATVERPLFSPTRRPPPPPAPPFAPLSAPAPALSPDPVLSLSGVISGGGGGVALLRRPQDAAPVAVPLGSGIDGWTVAEIRPRSIVLRRGESRVTVDLAAPPR